MVYIFSEFNRFEDINVNKFIENIKMIRLNLENCNYEVMFYFTDLEKLKYINFDYGFIKENNYLEAIDFIETYEPLDYKKIYIYLSHFNTIDIMINHSMFNQYLETLESICTQSEIDLWNNMFKELFKSFYEVFINSVVQIFKDDDYNSESISDIDCYSDSNSDIEDDYYSDSD